MKRIFFSVLACATLTLSYACKDDAASDQATSSGQDSFALTSSTPASAPTPTISPMAPSPMPVAACSDSDMGLKSGEAGVVTITTSGGKKIQYGDSCVGLDGVMEGACMQDGSGKNYYSQSPYNCSTTFPGQNLKCMTKIMKVNGVDTPVGYCGKTSSPSPAVTSTPTPLNTITPTNSPRPM